MKTEYSWYKELPSNTKKGFEEWFDEYERDYYEENYGTINKVTDLPEDELSYLFWDEGEFNASYAVEYRNMRNAVHEVALFGDDKEQAEIGFELLKEIEEAENNDEDESSIFELWNQFNDLLITDTDEVDYRTIRDDRSFIFINSEKEIPNVWA